MDNDKGGEIVKKRMKNRFRVRQPFQLLLCRSSPLGSEHLAGCMVPRPSSLAINNFFLFRQLEDKPTDYFHAYNDNTWCSIPLQPVRFLIFNAQHAAHEWPES
jgi:hypothetical protein